MRVDRMGMVIVDHAILFDDVIVFSHKFFVLTCFCLWLTKACMI